MADKPTQWLTATIRINVNRKNEGPGATPYGWIVRPLQIPILPAMPDHVEVDVVEGHRLSVKTRPLGWDPDRQEYRLADMTIVLSSAEIAHCPPSFCTVL